MSLRRRYLDMAGKKRLVIKNPFGLARVDMLKTMFPEALFVFALRAPWPTIRSATVKGNGSYIVPTAFVNSLPNDHILRAAATWSEAVDVLARERDANWYVVRYEELIATPRAVISELYYRTGFISDPVAIGATCLPEVRVKDFSSIKYKMMKHPYRTDIYALLEGRAEALGYSADLSKLPGNVLSYALQTWLGGLRKPRKRTAHLSYAEHVDVLAPLFEIDRRKDAA
jgi:hypothetical protein